MPQAFTSRYKGLSRELVNEVMIARIKPHLHLLSKSIELNINDYGFKQYKAIWDTGASGSVITKKIVEELNLKPTGMVTVNTAGGQNIVNTYIVDVLLPNKVIYGNLKVTEGKIYGGIDVLIGMDVISQGDFAVTNYNGKTVFSFKFPSDECIDFVKIIKQSRTIITSGKIARNDPCPCGSGKKYKHCCGKNK
jgi:predicted aspartyl protease